MMHISEQYYIINLNIENKIEMVIPCATSCMRTTLGCLISFIVEISRLICDSTTELVTHQQQKKKKKSEFWQKWQPDLYHENATMGQEDPS